MGQLDGKVAIVTGGGAGVGAGIVRRFVAEGAKVLIAELHDVDGPALADELGADAVCHKTDVRHRDQVDAMVAAAIDRWGTLDILVNNAWGGGEIGRSERKPTELLAHGMDVGFYGPLWAMQAAYPTMAAKGFGRIINLGSLNGVNAHMGTLEYNAAKEAMRAATRTAAREWAATGITANIICPAARSKAFLKVMGEHPDLLAAADSSNPMGRMGDPETDIAPVAVFLASEGSRYMTGNTLFVDGGGHINGSSWKPDLGD